MRRVGNWGLALGDSEIAGCPHSSCRFHAMSEWVLLCEDRSEALSEGEGRND